MVKVTMDQIMDFENNDDFFEDTVIPLKGAYKINKIKKNVNKEAEFYREKFQEIVDKYAKKDDDGNPKFSEDGNQILIEDGMIEECNNALEELQSLEVEIENYDLTIEDLGEGVEITPDRLEALMPFFS
jgi:hypothetical protein